MQRRDWMIIAGAATLAATTTAQTQGNAGQDEVLKANREFDEALSRRDLAAVSAQWVQDGQVMAVHPNGRPPVVGWEAVQNSWAAAFANFPELSVSMAEPRVRMSGEVAIVVGAEVIKGKRTDGTLVEFQAMTTNVYERRSGRWLMVHHQATRLSA